MEINREIEKMDLHNKKNSRFNGEDNVMLSKAVLKPSFLVASLINRYGYKKYLECITENVMFTLEQFKTHLYNFISQEKNIYYDKKDCYLLFIVGHLMDVFEKCDLNLIEECKKIELNRKFYEENKDLHLKVGSLKK